MYRKVRDPDKPKKPPTAYFYFLTDFRAQMAGQKIEKGRRLTEICGEEWNKLTEEQKKPYLDRVAIEYKKYQERMEEYRRKVSCYGNLLWLCELFNYSRAMWLHMYEAMH